MNQRRFEFGENWQAFLKQVDPERIQQACLSLRSILSLDSESEQPLAGKSFLDIGSGSGLFSLAALLLGADRVLSLDYDPNSVDCGSQLQTQLSSEQPELAERWQVIQGSVLDAEQLRSLGRFDVVYSWGVLHHTGNMAQAIENAARCVNDNGTFSLAIYNDQGGASRRWLKIKQVYNRLPKVLRGAWVLAIAGGYELKFAAARLVKGQNPLPFKDWAAKKQDRGMSAWHDWVDWIGGLPFEVAKPEDIILPLHDQGFHLTFLQTQTTGWGCNEFTFAKRPQRLDPE